ncbi:MAG: molybdopterin-binding protein [Methylocella sp.]
MQHIGRVNHSPANPRVQRLTPLTDALSLLSVMVGRCRTTECSLTDAVGFVLGSDLRASANLPTQAIAHADGWAVSADAVLGASVYGTVPLIPPPPRVDAGDPMPIGDAVLMPDIVTFVAPGVAEAIGSAVSGEGVRRRGQDIAAGVRILPEGTRLEPRHLGILKACGFETVPVRVPRIRLVVTSTAAAAHSDMVRAWLNAFGADVTEISPAPGNRAELALCFRRSADADLIISLGGTGQGRKDCTVAALGDVGSIALHGVALRPGAGIAFGQVGTTPVMLFPGEIDGLLAAFLVVAVEALGLLAGIRPGVASAPVRLTEKASSTVGFHELFLGIPDNDAIRPIPLAEAGFEALARATGWFLVPPASEGLAAGEIVHLRLFGAK